MSEILAAPEKILEAELFQIKSVWKEIPEYQIDTSSLTHLAIICDGNRRAAKERDLPPMYGHRLGIEVIKGVMRAGRKWGLTHLTFWTWSTENWKRDYEQVRFVMGLAAEYLVDQESIRTLMENEVRFRHFGRVDRMPEDVRTAIDHLQEITSNNNKLYVNLALDYGGLDEMARALARMIDAGVQSHEVAENPDIVLGYLDTGGQPVPDLVIRTGAKSGEIPHTSGFMPLQSAYSGWLFDEHLFPDLTPQNLLQSIQNFVEYERRFGK